MGATRRRLLTRYETGADPHDRDQDEHETGRPPGAVGEWARDRQVPVDRFQAGRGGGWRGRVVVMEVGSEDAGGHARWDIYRTM